MAIVLGEPEAEGCIEAVSEAEIVTVSAVTMAEALIIAQRRGVGEEMMRLFDELDLEVEVVTAATARQAAAAYRRWGKGRDPAGLNFGDCFPYALARLRSWPLLYVGEDFVRTDVAAAR